MPKLKDNQLPSYRLHKQSGQAIVSLNGKDFLLGVHNTAASRKEYDRVTSEWIANGRRLQTATRDPDLLIAELVLAFWTHAKQYYRRADGTMTSEVATYKYALKPMRTLYGDTSASEFGPLKLKAVRDKMVAAGWCRGYVNKQVNRLRHVFRWATENEMIPSSVCEALRSVSGLSIGRTVAPESLPVMPVSEQHVNAILPYLSRQVRAIVELQALTGARPGELLAMRTCDIDTTNKKNWMYRPQQHKTLHHGHERVIYIGPKARAILEPFLRPNVQEFIFSPAEAEADRLTQLHAMRKTPLTYGNAPGTNRVRRPQRQPADYYTVASYRRAIARACEKAFKMPAEIQEPQTKRQLEVEAKLPEAIRKQRKQSRAAARSKWHAENVWFPYQLRHTAATEIRKQFGLEAAQVILGHKTLTVTQIYAEKNVEAARKIMAEVG